ncbi:hypothetical protein BASA61_001448 [Batrachochytrium salamandrivorans]|nr:hypothetical protein BASA61_001448 [Batrachochytrium salamandrivorans]
MDIKMGSSYRTLLCPTHFHCLIARWAQFCLWQCRLPLILPLLPLVPPLLLPLCFYSSTPATTPASSPTTASTATVNPATPVAEPSWLKKAMRNDRPFWESPRRSSKRVIPPVRARVHPDSVPEDWVTTYIDNEPRTFYYPAIRE